MTASDIPLEADAEVSLGPLRGTVVLAGAVGSTAYGLAGPESDIDRLGTYAAPTEDFLGLRPPTDGAGSVVATDPDSVYHEVGKFCRLALGMNPTVTELLWLPPDLYEETSAWGSDLLEIRHHFLSAQRCRDAYFGYATQQMRRLLDRGDGTFSSDLRKRTAKHARHLRRLCIQGLELYRTGTLTVRLPDPEVYHQFGEAVAADPETVRPFMAWAEAQFDGVGSALPSRPEDGIVDAWLRNVRMDILEGIKPL